MANNYTSLKVVTDKLLRHPLMAGISFESVIDYAIDFMRIVQCAGFFEEKCVNIPVVDYKGVLPEDFYEVNQIRLSAKTIKVPKYKEVVITDDYGNTYSTNYIQDENCPYEEINVNSTNGTFRYATDTFHMSDVKSSIDLTYKIQGGYIFTSIKEGTVELSYQAILLDEEGFPLIPDNSKFTRALQAYIKKEWFTILFDLGKLQAAIYQNAQQEYAWAVGACESEFQKISLDKAESFYNSWSTLIPRKNQHQRFYSYNGSKQHLKMN